MDTYQWVTSHMWMSHGTHTNESRCINRWAIGICPYVFWKDIGCTYGRGDVYYISAMSQRHDCYTRVPGTKREQRAEVHESGDLVSLFVSFVPTSLLAFWTRLYVWYYASIDKTWIVHRCVCVCGVCVCVCVCVCICVCLCVCVCVTLLIHRWHLTHS